MDSPGWWVPNMLLVKSEDIALEGMKILSQSGNNTQLCMRLLEKLSSGHRTRKCQFSFQFQGKAMQKNAQTTAQLHSSHTLAK